MQSKLHLAALAYAEAGVPVFPCKVGSKTPATANGFYDASTDPGQINAWWNTEDYNVAFCPHDAGLIVIDIDPGASPGFLTRLPETYTVRTPRGGWHLYFEGSGKTSSNKLSAHVDTRGIGGYVLAPPSSVGGRHYVPQAAREYLPIPAWVSAILSAPGTPLKSAVEEKDLPGNIERARKVLERCIAREDVAIEGCGGDDRTYRLCCELLDLGLSVHTAKDLLEEIWNPHCQPSWSPEELDIKFENAQSYQQNEGGAYGVQPAEEAFGDAVRKLALPVVPEKLSRFYFRDEQEMDDEPDPKWLVKDLISERSTVMLYGASGSYKSFLALDICLALATGTKAFGNETQKGLVFYGALEGRAHLRKARRAWRIIKGVEGKIDNFFVGLAPMIGVDGEVQEFGDEITKRCGGNKPALIVIDTLSKSMAGMNENDAADAGKFIRFCDSLVEHFGCTVMAIHHNGKEEGRGARGSSAFHAGFDTVLEVKAHKISKAVSVYVRKHKDAEEREIPWTFEGRVTGPSLTFEQTTPEQHRMLIGEGKEVTSHTVGRALKELKAIGEDAGVSTAVLATQLTEVRESDSDETRANAIARAGRVLTSMSKGMLEAYCVKRGKGIFWNLPAA